MFLRIICLNCPNVNLPKSLSLVVGRSGSENVSPASANRKEDTLSSLTPSVYWLDSSGLSGRCLLTCKTLLMLDGVLLSEYIDELSSIDSRSLFFFDLSILKNRISLRRRILDLTSSRKSASMRPLNCAYTLEYLASNSKTFELRLCGKRPSSRRKSLPGAVEKTEDETLSMVSRLLP